MAPSSFRGVAFCHVPADEPIDLERLAERDGHDDRWNAPGEPTVYLAADPAIALAELARHLDVAAGDAPVRRRLLGLGVDVEGILDVRRPDVRRRLEGPDSVDEFADRGVARGVAARARRDEAVGGLLVPSMAFPDDPGRANLVLFVERLGGRVADIVRSQTEAGIVEIRPAAIDAPSGPPRDTSHGGDAMTDQQHRAPIDDPLTQTDPAAKTQPAEGGREEADDGQDPTDEAADRPGDAGDASAAHAGGDAHEAATRG